MAPTWDILGPYKKDKDQDKYMASFMPLMRQRMITDYDTWISIMHHETFAVGCYCNEGEFCHRHALVTLFGEFAKQEGIPFEYMGELSPN